MKHIWFACFCSVALSSTVFSQGPLAPSGAPAPGMKTLEQVEPRLAITSLPFLITRSGSYYLTQSFVSGFILEGITIWTNNVSIDLNGFTMDGGGGQNGIQSPYNNIRICNGTLLNWENAISMPMANNVQIDGITVAGCDRAFDLYRYAKVAHCQIDHRGSSYSAIRVADSCQISDCILSGGQSSGIYADNDAQITRCSISGFGYYGIQCGANSQIADCMLSSNHMQGIHTTDNALVLRCQSLFNGWDGFYVGGGSKVEQCLANGNSMNGIGVGSSSVVQDCNVRNNGRHGIEAPNDCLIKNNNCIGNGTTNGYAGIYVSSAGSRVEGNNCVLNGVGIQVEGNPNLIVANSCRWNSTGTSNFVIQAGNNYGQIITSPGMGFVNDNPWANFEF